MNAISSIALFLIALVTSVTTSGCATTGGGGSPIVGVVDAEFAGTTRTDGEILFVRGRFKGSAGLQSKYGGLPLIQTLETAENEWAVVYLLKGDVVRGTDGVDGIPLVVKTLYPPNDPALAEMLFESPPASAPVAPPST